MTVRPQENVHREMFIKELWKCSTKDKNMSTSLMFNVNIHFSPLLDQGWEMDTMEIIPLTLKNKKLGCIIKKITTVKTAEKCQRCTYHQIHFLKVL